MIHLHQSRNSLTPLFYSQFSLYLANAISNDRTDKFGSSDEDDEDDANWLGGSRFDPGDVDFALETDGRPQQSFGFDDRFDEAGPTAFRSAGGSDSDDVSYLSIRKLGQSLSRSDILRHRSGRHSRGLKRTTTV